MSVRKEEDILKELEAHRRVLASYDKTILFNKNFSLQDILLHKIALLEWVLNDQKD